MKTAALSIFLLLAWINLHAQNYLITFAGSGASTTVDSVKVENLTQCTVLSLAGSDTLNLSNTAGIPGSGNSHGNSIRIYRNPSPGPFSVELELTSDNMAYIGLYDMSGKEVLLREQFLTVGDHTFRLDGIRRGIYCLEIKTDHYKYAAKLVSSATSGSNPVLSYDGCRNRYDTGTKELKEPGSASSVISMQFSAGDTLKLTGKSGDYRTIMMLFPDQSQTVTFDFMDCTDADSNHYAVVQIGSQIWMEENLKTTRYRDRSPIPNVTDSAEWATVTTGAWCDYHNDPAEGAVYGHFYNFYAVSDSRNLCPAGWHVSTNPEWNIMEKFLDSTVDTTALMGTGRFIGRILKEGCDTRWQFLDTTAGYNSAGFTALCSNFRTASGSWSLAPDDNHDNSFWTATPYDANMAWKKSLRWCYRDIYSLFNFNRGGSSVRCVKD